MSDAPRLRFTFDGPLIVTVEQPAFVRLIGPDGTDVPLGPVILVGANALVADVLGDLTTGDHTATYEVISADGDPNFGSVRFDFDARSASATNCVEPNADEGGGGVGQILLIGGPLVALGAVLVGFNHWAGRRNPADVGSGG